MNTAKTYWLLLSTLLYLFSSSSSAQKPTLDKKKLVDTLKNQEVLIVYLSRTNNTKVVAEIINTNVGGKLVALDVENPYPADYQTMVNQVSNENATGYLPPLATRIDNIEKYDVIFIGFPTWGMQLPPPMKSFLNQYDLRGKTLVPFNTNGGYGVGSSFETVKELSSNSVILEGFSIRGGLERDGILFVMEGKKEKQANIGIQKWLRKIGLIK